TLLSDAASRRRPCASLALHLHQLVQGTCTPKLSNMLGTRLNRSAVGKTAISLTSGRPQPLALRLWLRSLLVPARYAVLSSGMVASRAGSAPVCYFAVVRRSSRTAPLTHLFNLH